MYFRNYLSDQEILTVACKTRRVNTEDKVYSYIREMIQQEIAQRDVAMNIDNSAERRAWFKELIEENTYYTADRCHVVSGCLTGMKAIVNDELLKKNVQPDEVTAENYSEKLDELLALTERLQFTDKQVKSLARRLSNSDVISCGGLRIDVLHDCENYVNYNCVNDTGAVLRVHYPNRDILFLADIEPAAARELMELYTPEQLRCDIVQLDHHGQGGAHRAFYELVQPKIAMYTAPDWLWTNRNGEGPFKTLETRRWMRELGVVLSCPHCHGDYLLV